MTRSDRVVIGCCLFYFCLGALWIDQPGLQADEVLFTQPLFDPSATAESMIAFHHPVPLMLMSYLGCLKTWLYAPLIAFAGQISPSSMAALVRLPMLAAMALTIWITYRIVRRLHSERAGMLIAILLATDTLYLWLSRCDWGPITLQHLLAASGVWMLLRFYDSSRAPWLAGAGFLFGLAFWDKTIFLWPAAALLTSAALLWREIRPLVTVRALVLLIASFSLGAYPWIRHNVRSHGATFNDTAHFSTGQFHTKAISFFRGLNGVTPLGYIVRESEQAPQLPPSGALARASVRLAIALGFPRNSLTGWAFLAALALTPFLGRQSRIVAVMLAAGYLLMAFTKDGGLWPYHSSVLWPLPHLMIVLALMRLPKIAAAGSIAILAFAGLALTNTAYAQLHLYGPSIFWSDSIYRLPATLAKHPSSHPAAVIDWGILEPVQLLTHGGASIEAAYDHKGIAPGTLYVSRTAGNELLVGADARLEADARAANCRLRVVDTVDDSHGIAMLQLQVCE